MRTRNNTNLCSTNLDTAVNRAMVRFASVEWRNEDSDKAGQYTPVSKYFDDVYYSPTNAIQESYYNFLQGTDIIFRFYGSGNIHVGETGFGTGLNFILTLKEFLEKSAIGGTLQYWSVEKFPMHKADMSRGLNAILPDDSTLINTLVSAMPDLPTVGWHEAVLYNGRVHLNIYFGDGHDFATADTVAFPNDVLDILYLDGFTPQKNPDMWTSSLLGGLYNKCKVGATFATFTASSSVRRTLQAVGFEVEKTKGFARKRERLIGRKV